MNRILVIASHPDDEVLGCGAAIKRFSQEGKEVHVCILGEGITSRNSLSAGDQVKMLSDLHVTSHRVASFLGAKSCRVGDFPDNRFDTVALLDVAKYIEKVINELQPDTLFTQSFGDLNVDHSVTFRSTLIAARPMLGSSVKRFLSYEVNSSSEWGFGQLGAFFKPNFFLDISQVVDAKILAMKMYEGESREFPHPRSDIAILAQAQKWGSVCGCSAAEAFQTVFDIL